jgi:hypothetical protein
MIKADAIMRQKVIGRLNLEVALGHAQSSFVLISLLTGLLLETNF